MSVGLTTHSPEKQERDAKKRAEKRPVASMTADAMLGAGSGVVVAGASPSSGSVPGAVGLAVTTSPSLTSSQRLRGASGGHASHTSGHGGSSGHHHSQHGVRSRASSDGGGASSDGDLDESDEEGKAIFSAKLSWGSSFTKVCAWVCEAVAVAAGRFGRRDV